MIVLRVAHAIANRISHLPNVVDAASWRSLLPPPESRWQVGDRPQVGNIAAPQSSALRDMKNCEGKS
jgi:hypothetical protein